ncbi:MAG TPA: hypothetical protein VG841_14165 [Caulobacterales bacterium]|nr:hypothetical protein [Caulobacterales bacterium]
MLWALVVFVAAAPGANSSSLDTNLKFATLADCRAAERDMTEFLARQQFQGAAQCVSLSQRNGSRLDWSGVLRRVR